jgi:mannitol/fructose-specific phosphotransferase system IIA component (Ntr-type)
MENPASRRVSLSEIISQHAVKLQLVGQNRDAVLAELVDQIQEISNRPDARQSLLHALQEREQLHSTGIGDGIALPHARNALVGLVDHSVIVFGRHPAGINYGAIDGAPAQLFFLLLAPTVTLHLSILARLSRILRIPKLRKALLAAESPEKVIALIREAETQA